MEIQRQHEIIMDWIYEYDHPCFSVHDIDFCEYWSARTGLSERTLKKRINELVKSSRLDKQRITQEDTRPCGVPKWFFIYS